MQVTFDVYDRKDRAMVIALLSETAQQEDMDRAPMHEEEPDERIPQVQVGRFPDPGDELYKMAPTPTDADEPQMEKDLAAKKAAIELMSPKPLDEQQVPGTETPVVDELVFDDIVSLLRIYLKGMDADARPAAQDKLRIVLKEATGVSGTADLKEDQYRTAYEALNTFITGEGF